MTHVKRTRLATMAGALAVMFAGAMSPPASATVRRIVATDDAIGFVVGPARTLYVIGQQGKLRPLVGSTLGDAVLDLSDDVSGGNEQGLLGAVFSADGTWLYTNHTDRDETTQITAWPVSNGKPDLARKRVLLSVEQPFSNHNGGHLVLDSLGVLWIGLGDGGSGGDPGNRAQNPKTLLGKMLRIVPTPEAERPYAIPAGNLPASKGLPEIWGIGLRNPWRYSIDEARNRIWIADVGQNEWEEISVAPLDAVAPNFGWPNSEGRHSYDGRRAISGAIRPVLEYRHRNGACSVTGGVVLSSGSYVFVDYCSGKVRVVDANGRSRTYASGTVKNAAGFVLAPDGRLLAASRGNGVVLVTR